MEIKLGLTIIQKICAIFKSLFWKNKNVIYVNSNVKIFNIEESKYLVKPSDVKIINCQSKKSSSLKDLKRHFLIMRINLFQILRNLRESSKITYCGFCSTMFSIYDGYQIGNTTNFQLIDFNKNYYLINDNIEYSSKKMSLDDSKKEINIVISSSYDISNLKIKDFPSYRFDIKEPNLLNGFYLSNIYFFVKSILDSCGDYNIKKVNLYVAAKQSVNFVVGLAIQNYHPQIYVYEYRENKFKYCMDLFNNKIIEE